MMKTRMAGIGALVMAAAGLAGGCAGDASVATEMGIPEVYVQRTAGDAEPLTESPDAAEVTRSVEGGVTVIRGLAPGQLQAIASTSPASNGRAARAAGSTESDVAPAPGALVAPDQLAMVAAPPAVPVTPVSGRPLAASLAPAAGDPSPSSAGLQLAEVQNSATLAPTNIEALEARGAVRLTTDEIEALSVGNTITHINAENGFSVSTYYHPGGESRLITGDRGLPSRYQIGDGLRCRIDMQGVGVCALLYRDGPTTWVCEQDNQGMCSWYVGKVEEGYILG